MSRPLPWEGYGAEPSVMYHWCCFIRYLTETGLGKSCVADARDFWLLSYLLLLCSQHLSWQPWGAPCLGKSHFAASFLNSLQLRGNGLTAFGGLSPCCFEMTEVQGISSAPLLQPLVRSFWGFQVVSYAVSPIQA